VPVAIVYVRSLVVAPAFAERYLIIVAPAAYLLTARAITQLPLRRAATTALAIGLPALLLVHLVAVERYFSTPTKEQFREAAAYLVRHDAPDANAVIVASTGNPAYVDYYLERLGSPRRVDLIVRSADDRAAVARLIDARSADAVWLLAAHRRPPPELVAWLGEKLQLVGERELLGAHVWHFVPRPRAVPQG
jgi:mannosyltransferase